MCSSLRVRVNSRTTTITGVDDMHRMLTAERADTNLFELTHEFVAQMVGAPLPVVSESFATLRDQGVIDYRRGVLTIRNSKKLWKVACECAEAMSRSSNGGHPAARKASH